MQKVHFPHGGFEMLFIVAAGPYSVRKPFAKNNVRIPPALDNFPHYGHTSTESPRVRPRQQHRSESRFSDRSLGGGRVPENLHRQNDRLPDGSARLGSAHGRPEDGHEPMSSRCEMPKCSTTTPARRRTRSARSSASAAASSSPTSLNKQIRPQQSSRPIRPFRGDGQK